jgi:hypothetical protein
MVVKVPAAILKGIDAVRESGLVNMAQANVVTAVAFQKGFEETANWIAANPELYRQGFFEGFECDDADAEE